MNMISWILIGVCSFLGLLLILILAIGCSKNDFCRGNPRSSDSDCFHERNLAELSANRLQIEPNVYLPLDTFRSNPSAIPSDPAEASAATGSAVTMSAVDQSAVVSAVPATAAGEATALVTRVEEPPPSYDSLFPTADDSNTANNEIAPQNV